MGAGFYRSYFEFPQPAGAGGRLIFHCSAPCRIIYAPQVYVKTLQTLTAPFNTHFAEVLMSKQSIRSESRPRDIQLRAIAEEVQAPLLQGTDSRDASHCFGKQEPLCGGYQKPVFTL